MAKWNVELSCGIGFTVTGVEAETKDQAIEKAKAIVLDHTSITPENSIDIQVEAGNLEYDQCTYIQKERD